jgi:hypothetical protein
LLPQFGRRLARPLIAGVDGTALIERVPIDRASRILDKFDDGPMKSYLYKVSAPRGTLAFQLSTFWRTPDWESSTTRCREGYIKDQLLYAGDFDEVSIHLFPRVRTVRVRSVDGDGPSLRGLGFECATGRSAHIFIQEFCRQEVESFHPTIFRFSADGFVRVRRGEHVSRKPQRAISVETVPMGEAINRWNIEVCYVNDLDVLIDRLCQARIYYDEQT